MGTKNSRLKILSIFLALQSFLLFTACSRSSPQVLEEDIVAFVNDQPITKTALEQEMRSMYFLFEMRAKQGDIDEFLQHAGREWSQMSPDEKRYYLRAKRQREEKGDKNEAFNRLVRQEVQYQEAVKRGYKITVEEARQINQQVEEASRQSLSRADDKTRMEALEMDKKFMETMGFKTTEALTEYRVSLQIKKAPVSRLHQEFAADLRNKHPEAHSGKFRFIVENQWEDYTEDLLHHAKIEILDQELKIFYYSQ